MRGPIDYIIVGFPGNKFRGEILDALNEAVQNETIAVLDLSVITKDEQGNLSSLELTPFHEVLSPEAETTTGNLIDEDDLQEVGEMLENNCSAGLLIIEHVWARDLKQAIANADGTLLADGRIHPDAYDALNAQEEE
jgi:uncharacterized membrane protein